MKYEYERSSANVAACRRLATLIERLDEQFDELETVRSSTVETLLQERERRDKFKQGRAQLHAEARSARTRGGR